MAVRPNGRLSTALLRNDLILCRRPAVQRRHPLRFASPLSHGRTATAPVPHGHQRRRHYRSSKPEERESPAQDPLNNGRGWGHLPGRQWGRRTGRGGVSRAAEAPAPGGKSGHELSRSLASRCPRPIPTSFSLSRSTQAPLNPSDLSGWPRIRASPYRACRASSTVARTEPSSSLLAMTEPAPWGPRPHGSNRAKSVKRTSDCREDGRSRARQLTASTSEHDVVGGSC